MTEHLYYHDSFLNEFDAEVLDVVASSSSDARPAVILDRTAFYPTSGGQTFDTGWILPATAEGNKWRVAEVLERDDGTILHILESSESPGKGTRVRGLIDAVRRRDHMQQHSGQHVLSAAFVRLFELPTVSFHMGTASCSIDLEGKSLSSNQVEEAEALANTIVMESRPVQVRFVGAEEARGLGLRKIPAGERERLRLVDIRDFDLTACGGTHVNATGQIGCILLRKTEKVRQGWRVEFTAGQRSVSTARQDYAGLAEAAGQMSCHAREVAQQILKLQEESREARKASERILAELTDFHAARLFADAAEANGRRVVAQVFADRDLAFIKLLAQRLARQSGPVIALLAATAGQPALVFAQSPGQPFDMGALMKQALERLGGRGGGSKDMAQGGFSKAEEVEPALRAIAQSLA